MTRDAQEALRRVEELFPRIVELIEFEQEAERDVTALMIVRNHLRRAIDGDNGKGESE